MLRFCGYPDAGCLQTSISRVAYEYPLLQSLIYGCKGRIWNALSRSQCSPVNNLSLLSSPAVGVLGKALEPKIICHLRAADVDCSFHGTRPATPQRGGYSQLRKSRPKLSTRFIAGHGFDLPGYLEAPLQIGPSDQTRLTVHIRFGLSVSRSTC